MIRKIKSFLFVILALIIAVCFAGCGEYVYGVNAPSNNPSTSNPGGNRPGVDPEDPDPPVKPNPNPKPGEDEEPEIRVFTVTLVKEGITYTNTDGIKAQWVNRFGVYSAEFVKGVATIEGLDGEYHVTLSSLPQEKGKEYTYDCNGYIANNTKKDIKIELLEILNASGGMNGWTELKKLGTYRTTIRTKSYESLYYYYPNDPGWYSITSWVDTTENKINPKVNIYNGNAFSGFKVLDRTVDSGGSSSTYTKNFRFEVKLSSDEIGNNQIFGVMADSAGGYPVTVDFTVKYEGEYIRQDDGDPVYAEGPFYTGAKPSGTFDYIYKDNPKGFDSHHNPIYNQDETNVKLKETGDGAGYYHLYDEEKYADNGGWGPMLFAKITKDTEVFWTIDDGGTHVDGGFNWNWVASDDGKISCIIDGYNYAYMISNTNVDGVKRYGYAQYCNVDGVHPVTEELKKFLQGYAVREWLFDDGEGMAEDSDLNTVRNDNGAVLKPGICLQSSENNQWLFACGYYR